MSDVARRFDRLGWTFTVLRGRTDGQPASLAAVIRFVWTRHVLRHDGEVCHRCGRRVDRCTHSWWSAPDDLWIEHNGGFGLLCPPCFHDIARANGTTVYFQAVSYARS